MDLNALRTAIGELERHVSDLTEDQEPSLDALQEWADVVWRVNHAQLRAAQVLLKREMALGDRYVLSDDRGEDHEPEETIIAAGDSLRSMETQVGQADAAAYDHRTRVNHLVVERALEAGEEPSLVVRRSTAARMALRDRSSYSE